MANQKPPGGRSGDDTPNPSPITQERELILVADPTAQMQAVRGMPASANGDELLPFAAIMRDAGATIRPVFPRIDGNVRGLPNDPTAGAAAGDGTPQPDLSVYFRVDAPDARLDGLAESLRAQPGVEAAYIKPPAMPAQLRMGPPTGSTTGSATGTVPGRYEPGVATGEGAPLNEMLPTADDVPTATPNFMARQAYLTAAPDGVDALFAWTQPGGTGAGVRIIDVEGAWRFTHEDLVLNQGGVVGGAPSPDPAWRNHGTAVMGEIGGDRNAFGIVGICPDAFVRGISIFGGLGSAGAIVAAANLLSAGDIILVELHRAGPAATGVGQQGYIAVEWWPDDYAAVHYATGRGVVVIEAAGNGAQNLDAAIYDAPAPGFPAGWANPFRRGARDSGAILVGAGAPPPGTHGRNWGPDRSRLDFSNFGACVDAQGWGREVTTTGYGDLQGGPNEDLWYTDQFSGTSSASPIVVGAVGCAQGNRRARGLAPLAPRAARDLLRTTGSPQQASAAAPLSQRIGNRPNLRQMLTTGVTLATPLYRYWNAGNTDHFYTTNWNELGWGRSGWGLEGTQCYVYQQAAPGTVRLYRYWNASIGDHFYTTDWSELGGGAHGWAYEGVQCYVYPSPGPQRVPLYRYWNAGIGDHFYTTNWGELGAGAHGWRFERIQCYVKTMALPPAAPGGPEADDSSGSTPPDINAKSPDGTTIEPPPVGPVPAMTSAFADATSTGATMVPDSFRTAQSREGEEVAKAEPVRKAGRGFTITVRQEE